MSEPIERSDSSLFRDLIPFLKQDKGLYILALALAPGTAAMVVLQPWLLKQVIDRYITPGDIEGLQTAAWWYLGAVVVGFVLEAGHTLALSYAATRTITRVRSAIYKHTLAISQRYHGSHPTGQLLTRTTSDVEALGETLTAGAITIVLDVLQVIGILVAMVWLDVKLTLTLLLVAPVLALLINVLRKKLRKLYGTVRTSLSNLNAYLSERLAGVQVIQLYGDEERAREGFDERLHTYRDATIRTNIWDALLYASVDGLTSVTMALMLWYGAGMTLKGAATAGLLAAFIDYVQKLFRPIQEFSQKVATIQRAGAALSKIFGLLDVDDIVTGGDASLGEDPPKGAVELKDVCFAYREGAPDVLHHVDLQVAPGEVLALVGRTGSGKSTLGLLMSRAFEGYRGSITLDGVEIADLPVPDVRHAIGAVRQDVQLFAGTVRFNLTLGAEKSEEAIADALKAAHATGIVERLGGLEGRIEENGRNLSAGEGQLLSFARTLLYDPAVVILDEATANVDSLTEARIQAATEAILERKTTVVIAHRLSTIMKADRIVLLSKGKVVETGSHAELMAKGGAYAGLFRQQYAAQGEAEAG